MLLNLTTHVTNSFDYINVGHIYCMNVGHNYSNELDWPAKTYESLS